MFCIMVFKRKFIVLLLLVVLLEGCMYFFKTHKHLVNVYDQFIFYPFQSFRTALFSFIPFSIGDVIYVLGGFWALITIIRWSYFIVKFGAYKRQLAASLLRCINTALFVYLFFVFGWGANYYKEPLRRYWSLDSSRRKKTDTSSLIAFDKFLLGKLNSYSTHYHALSLSEINKRAKTYYRIYTDCKVNNGLNIKPTLFGNIMERFDIEGYYNPFTGEGQVNNKLPVFMLPFTVCHEMAHQAGIAAEEDANLMAYTLGTAANDSTFSYSCYLNIWLYTNDRLFFHDSALANRFESQLNKLSRAHIDTLDAINRKFHSELTKYSGAVYDSYLRMQNQKEGIRSYGNVASSAWQLEKKRDSIPVGVIRIP